MDLYEVEIITSSGMEDVREVSEEREEGKEEKDDNDDPVSIELVELKARALRCKHIFATEVA